MYTNLNNEEIQFSASVYEIIQRSIHGAVAKGRIYEYERLKTELSQCASSSLEYQEACKIIAKNLGV